MRDLREEIMESVMERAALVKSTLIDHIQRVDLRVRDIEAALSFYRDVVGLEVVEQSETHATLRSEDGPAFLELDSSGVTEPADPRATGLFHTAIRFPTRPSLGDALTRLAEAELAIGAGDHLVSEALYIDDPDGNGVELYWDRPEAEWPPPSGDMIVPMATLPVDLEALLALGSGRAAIGEKAPIGTDVGHVHLQVSDLDATAAFFGDVLGLDVTGKLGNQAGFFSSNGYHHHIGSNTWRSRGGKPSARNKAGLERIVFAVSGSDEFSALSARLSDRGADISVEDGRLTVHDPDGIELVFVSE
jgi:catechol 2,3-dioxygenase